MTEYDPTSPHESLPARPVSSATSGPSEVSSAGGAGIAPPPPPVSLPDSSASVTMAKPARWPRVWRLLSNRLSGWIVAGALMLAVIGLSIGLATSPSATAAPTVPGGGVAGAAGGAGSNGQPGPAAGGGLGGGGSNARSGPAEGGATGTVDSVSTPSFTISTATGQKVTVNEASSTTYQNGTSSTSASAITTGESVLVVGTVNAATGGTTIAATQVTVQPTGDGGSATSSAAGVVPFQRGAAATSKQVGQIPNYTEGQGTIVSGTTADKATEAALAAYPGGVVDRVVQLSNGEYEVHNIGVQWPHHAFVDQNFKVVGAN